MVKVKISSPWPNDEASDCNPDNASLILAGDSTIWCNSHNRLATHVDRNGRPQCDPTLGGILLPCSCVDVTGLIEILPP